MNGPVPQRTDKAKIQAGFVVVQHDRQERKWHYAYTPSGKILLSPTEGLSFELGIVPGVDAIAARDALKKIVREHPDDIWHNDVELKDAPEVLPPPTPARCRLLRVFS